MHVLDPIRKKVQHFFSRHSIYRPEPGTIHNTGASIALVIDRSMSMADRCGRLTKLQAAQEAAIALLAARREMRLSDRVALIPFNHEAELILPFTPVPPFWAMIEQMLRSFDVGGGTDLAAGLELIRGKLAPPDHLILLTDGQGGDPTPAAEDLKRRGTIIETIGVGNSPDEVDESLLRRTASVLDGKVLYRFIRDGRMVIRYFQTEIATRLVKR